MIKNELKTKNKKTIQHDNIKWKGSELIDPIIWRWNDRERPGRIQFRAFQVSTSMNNHGTQTCAPAKKKNG